MGLQMSLMILFGVKYPKHDDPIAFHPIKQFVRKSLCDEAAKTVVINWALFGPYSKKSDCTLNFIQQIIPQARSSRIVP